MSALETPRHRIEGLGSAHSGLQQFWRLRVSGAALGPLSLWFVYSALGLVGRNQVSTLAFLQHPVNAVLMGTFVLLCTYHMTLGLKEAVEDYVHTDGVKLLLVLLSRVFGFAVAIAAIVALLRIALA